MSDELAFFVPKTPSISIYHPVADNGTGDVPLGVANE
jgi:hypothetical protein